jgi:hypothetical protein
VGKKLKRGDAAPDLSITEFNRHVDASDFVHRNLMLGGGGAHRQTAHDTNLITVKNVSGALRRQGEILEFTDIPLTDLSARQLILNGGSPTLANGFGVLLEPVANNDGTPYCQVAGGCIGLVNVTNASHKFAKVISANYVLQSAESGPVRILYKPGGTGERTCGLLIGAGTAVEIYRGITDGQLNKASTGNVKRYNDGTDTESGPTDSVKNDLASVKTGKIVLYIRLGSNFYLLNSEKVSHTALSNIRIKTGNAQIEAEDLEIFADSVDSLAYADKIPLTACP